MTDKVLALIPARSGSKTIAHKNIRIIGGKPLLAHSIEHALASVMITRTIVSTDSPEYAAIARQYGAEVPFLRPAQFAQDLSTDLETFEHALTWLAVNESYIPNICVHLRPTYPVRRITDIDRIVQILHDNPEIDSVRSMAPTSETPFKMWFRDESGFATPVVQTEIPEAHSMPRQRLPQVYLQNACVDAVRTRVITEQKSIAGTRVYGYLMETSFDIDTEEQFQAAAAAMQGSAINSRGLSEPKIFCFDIDGVIANLVPGNNYSLATPVLDNVQIVNALYDQGHRIILFTARGSVTGLDWTEATRQQLAAWGVRYHELRFGKPAADFYVDDKMLSLQEMHCLLPVK